ncbi:3-oxoacyl-ACP reductase [Rothia kristinae]|uniref:3-oxoacyl-ACP reductase n=1 Tax=Rothia kristinae TaxID=37923 RepID=UPI002E2C720D|nr:3-oxoacyl-ACP reductase [Rothia kristinae]MED6046280.1 3-oxoacyl-ACP reductase [Rothia kristinae]
MKDSYTQLVNSPIGKKLAEALGLPRPTALRRDEPGAPLLADPRVLVVGGPAADPLARRLLAWDLEVHRHPSPGTTYGAIIADFTAATDPGQLQEIALGVGAALRSLGSSGRIVVLGRTGSTEDDPELVAAQAGVVGFMRSLAHESRRGATCNALLLDGDFGLDAPALEGPLRFLLSARSAYVSGQPLVVAAADGPGAPDPERPLEGKVAVVTGAARGIGAAIVRRLHADGARLLLVDVPAAGEALTKVANEVSGQALQLDITAEDAGRRIAETARRAFGTLDVVIHNAGITRDKMLANMDAARWGSVLAVNLSSQLRMNRQLLESGALGQHPRIVCLASTSGIAGNKGQTNYAASKAGIIGMVAAEAEDLAETGGTINAVAPGFIETEMTRAMPTVTREVARRLNSLSQGGRPEDVAQAVAFLASDAAAGVNGQTLRVCGQSMVGA